MYLLNDTPILLEFLKRTIKLFDDKPKYFKKLENEFFIAGKCNCNQSDCSTVYLKRRKEWKENDYKYSFHTNDCNVNIIPYGKNYLEIECIRYNDFPHKKEINKLFGKRKQISSSYPRISKKINKLTKKDKEKIDNYFKYSKRVSIYEKTIKHKLDFRIYQN